MHCPNCKGDTTVIDSRVSDDCVKRRRMCLKCGKKFSTKEILVIPVKRKTIYSYDNGLTWTEKKDKEG